MKTIGKTLLLILLLAAMIMSLLACSSSRKMAPTVTATVEIAPALTSAERLIQFVESGDSVLLHGIFTDSILNRMSVNDMVGTRKDFVRSFGKLLRAEGPNYDSDSTASIVFHHQDMTLIAYLELNRQGQIRSINILQELDGQRLGAF